MLYKDGKSDKTSFTGARQGTVAISCTFTSCFTDAQNTAISYKN
jgi:hypothetical protein